MELREIKHAARTELFLLFFVVDTISSERPQSDPHRAVFRRRHRLKSGGFDPVFQARLRKSRGPITLHLRPSGLDEHRLGLSIGRRLGNAVVRGRFKRMMREVFRLNRESMPTPADGGAYDIVVTTRAHEPATIEQYREWFMDAMQAAHRVHEKRAKDGDHA